MCESLEASLSLSLEAFIGTELEQANRLKQEAEEMTEGAETAFAKYLHGKNAQNSASAAYMAAAAAAASASSGGSGNNNTGGNAIGGNGINDDISSWNKLSENVGNQLGRIGITAVNNDNSLSPMKGRKGKKHNNDRGKDPMMDEAISAAYLRQNLEEIRYSQANAEMKRFQLLKHVDALKVCFIGVIVIFLVCVCACICIYIYIYIYIFIKCSFGQIIKLTLKMFLFPTLL